MWRLICLILVVGTAHPLFAAPKHRRDGSHLPEKERSFAEQLTIQKRKVFCGRFSYTQRQAAMKYASRGKDSCLTPDEAVIRVMEESGMSLAVKHRGQCKAR